MASDADVRRQEAGSNEVSTSSHIAALGERAARPSASAPVPDTIAAIATAPGRAGIGVVRVSGSAAASVARAITGSDLTPRHASYRNFRDDDGRLLDQGIAIYFPAPHSYTGEDVLELQGHGGDAVLQLLLQRCLDLGCRLAEPGEFSKRAFLNDKLDLAQAEAVADLIDAASAQAAKSAVRSLSGEFSCKVRALSEDLVELRTFVEASLDFPEEDIEPARRHDFEGKLRRVSNAVKSVLAQAENGVLIRSGLRVVILGEPNVGKSSLLNRLAGEEIAIVTPIPGTTRDSLRERISIEGVPVHIVDTAGLRETGDEVERIGVERARDEAAKADLGLLVRDATCVTGEQSEAIRSALPKGLQLLEVANKIDLLSAEFTGPGLGVSAKTGKGIELLRQAILRHAGWHSGLEHALIARERHAQALLQAHTYLESAAVNTSALDLLAEELRLAHSQLVSITGEFSADDLLGEIFSRFCIGK